MLSLRNLLSLKLTGLFAFDQSLRPHCGTGPVSCISKRALCPGVGPGTKYASWRKKNVLVLSVEQIAFASIRGRGQCCANMVRVRERCQVAEVRFFDIITAVKVQ